MEINLPPYVYTKRINAFFLIVTLAFLAIGVWRFLYWGEMVSGKEVDDAGITFAFANHLADGYGIVLYPGGERVEGYSNPSWMFLLALGNLLGLDVFLSSKMMGYFFGALSILFVALFSLKGNRHGFSWPMAGASFFVATSGALAIWSMTGLESSLYIFLIVASAYRLFVECEKGTTAFPISPFLFFLLSITRPEGIAFFILAMGYRLITVVIPERKISKRDVFWIAAFLLPWAAYQIWHYIYFAWPLPNTYYGKLLPRSWGEIFSKESHGVRYVISFFKAYKLQWLLLLIPFAFLVKGGRRRTIYLLSILAFTIFFPIYANGDWMRGWRFCAPIIPPLFLLAAMGIEGIIQGCFLLAGKKLKPLPRHITAIAISAVFFTSGFFLLYPTSKENFRTYAKKPAARIMGIKRRTDFFRKAMRKLRFGDYEATFLDMDMGSVALFSKMKIIDVGRICNVPIAHHFNDKKRLAKFMDEYVLGENPPDFAHIRKKWGRDTTLLNNRNFIDSYFYLPENKKVSKPPGGNYVKKDLIIFPKAPYSPWQKSFDPGMTLLYAKLNQNISRKKSSIWLRLFWRRDSEENLPEMKFRILLENDDGERIALKPYKPIMGFYHTDKWEKNQVIGEWVKVKIPKKIKRGLYGLIFQVLDYGSEEVLEEAPLFCQVAVDNTLAAQLGKRTFASAIAMAKEGRIEIAYKLYDQAMEYYGGHEPKRIHSDFENSICRGAVMKSRSLIDEGKLDQAGDALLLARKHFPKSKEVNSMLWILSGKKVKAGKTAVKDKDWNRAYECFNRAAVLQPFNSWARKYAEQVRSFRYN